MSRPPRIICVLGTRPDAIKTAPVVLELRKYASQVETLIVSTGQHREILDPVLKCFDLKVDIDLQIMQDRQTLSQITSRAMEGIDNAVRKLQPDYLLVQGDTTSSYVACLAAFYNQIPCGHIEAGLRTSTIDSPYPEEFNRRSITLLARQHFAPTEWAAANLRREGVLESEIYVTGNTGIDALQFVAKHRKQSWYSDFHGSVVLITTHRRENWGRRQRETAQAIVEIANKFPATLLVVSVHPNPRVREIILPILSGHERIKLIEPPEYGDFVKLMERSSLILTDSGGIQEEAPAFGIPVLVLREETERPEGIKAGVAKIVGTDHNSIFDSAAELLGDAEAYRRMSKAISPYGDGHAAPRIRLAVLQRLGIESDQTEMFNVPASMVA